MRLRMLQTKTGSPDGVSSMTFPKGECEVPEDLAVVFLREGWAVPVDTPVAPSKAPEPRAAPVQRAPKDKAAKAPQRRKTTGGRAKKS